MVDIDVKVALFNINVGVEGGGFGIYLLQLLELIIL